jgi:asparagine synthase (glutamine-hydrolysing)
MCGFVGSFKADAARRDDRDHLDSAIAAIRRRGPDGNGAFRTDWLRLGHTRLAIIDPTAGAQQPMADGSGRFVIVFNGEIYNFRELFERYLDGDETVNRHSDTAVLLALYKKLGRDCVSALNGMFAFAVADLQRRTVFMARDRFGEKPLYWTRRGEETLFGSELRALKALKPDESWPMDPHSVALYQMLGSVPPPRSIVRDVQALIPGRWIEFRHDGSMVEGTFWSLAEARQPEVGVPYEKAVEETQARLSQAVQSRMVSDVEVGLFLSGGYDSGAILGTLKSLKMTPIRTVSLDFADARFSEYNLVEITARAYDGIPHRMVISHEVFLDGLDDFFRAMDQPTSDGYNTYFVSRAAHELGIKVWLSGIGGDELFGGYPFFRRIGRLQDLSRTMQRVVPRGMTDWVAPRLMHRLRLSRVAHLADRGDPFIRAYQACRTMVPWRNALALLAPDLRRKMEAGIAEELDRLYEDPSRMADDCQRATLLESTMYMRSQLLRDMDNFSMAHSIELRAPYLDHALCEYVQGLPQDFKIRDGLTKPLLADALPIPLPPVIRQQSKRGFSFPVQEWLKEHMALSFRQYALDPACEAFWDLQVISDLWSAYLAGRVHYSVIWNLYAFARWVKDHHESL